MHDIKLIGHDNSRLAYVASEYKYVSSLVVMNSSAILVAPVVENLPDFTPILVMCNSITLVTMKGYKQLHRAEYSKGSQSLQTVKYRHESRGTRNRE
jgi:hypothetical protein